MDVEVIEELEDAYKKTGRKIWKRVKEEVSKKGRREVMNVSKIEKIVPDGAVIVFVGKVLGEGNISKKISVGALGFSESAREKINRAGGEALLLGEFVKKYMDKSEIIIVK